MESIAKTLFIPFYFRYLESISKKEIYDNEAVEFFKNLDNLNLINFSDLDKDIYSHVGTIARTKIIDSLLLNLLKSPIDNIFNIGCGLDFKNRRLSIQKPWYNIDLPPVIQFRNKNFLRLDFEKNIGEDLLKSANWDFVPNEVNVFILEGVSMYLLEEEILSFIKNMCNFSKKAYFIIESAPLEALVNRHPSVHKVDDTIIFKWGTNNIKEFATKANVEFLESYKHSDFLKNRWPQNDDNNKLVQALKNNYRISLLRYEKGDFKL